MHGKIYLSAAIAGALALGAVSAMAESAGSSTGSYKNKYADKAAGSSTGSYTSKTAGSSTGSYTGQAAGTTYTGQAAGSRTGTNTDVMVGTSAGDVMTSPAPAGNYVNIGPYVGPTQ